MIKNNFDDFEVIILILGYFNIGYIVAYNKLIYPFIISMIGLFLLFGVILLLCAKNIFEKMRCEE